MKNILAAFFATVSTVTLAVTFAPKEYVDRVAESNRNAMVEYVNSAVEPFCTKAALERYMPIEGTNTAIFTVGALYSNFGHINEMEVGAQLSLGSWDTLRVSGSTITMYGDSRYVRNVGVTNVILDVAGTIPRITSDDVRTIVTNVVDAGYTKWTILRDGVDVTSRIQQPTYIGDENEDIWWVGNSYLPGEDLEEAAEIMASKDVLELTWRTGNQSLEEVYFYIATRARVSRNTLGLARLEDVPDTSGIAASVSSNASAIARLSLAGSPPFDFSNMRGVYLSLSNIIHALGGSVTNFPAFEQ